MKLDHAWVIIQSDTDIYSPYTNTGDILSVLQRMKLANWQCYIAFIHRHYKFFADVPAPKRHQPISNLKHDYTMTTQDDKNHMDLSQQRHDRLRKILVRPSPLENKYAVFDMKLVSARQIALLVIALRDDAINPCHILRFLILYPLTK